MNKKQCVSHIFILFFLILYQTISMLIFGYYVCNSMSITHTRTCVGRLMSISLCQNIQPHSGPRPICIIFFVLCLLRLPWRWPGDISFISSGLSLDCQRKSIWHSKRLLLDHTMSLHNSTHRWIKEKKSITNDILIDRFQWIFSLSHSFPLHNGHDDCLLWICMHFIGFRSVLWAESSTDAEFS